MTLNMDQDGTAATTAMTIGRPSATTFGSRGWAFAESFLAPFGDGCLDRRRTNVCVVAVNPATALLSRIPFRLEWTRR